MHSEILELERDKVVKDVLKIEEMVSQGHWTLMSMSLCNKLSVLNNRLENLNKTIEKFKKGELNNEEDI